MKWVLYPLDGLSNLLKFIPERDFYRIINCHTEDIIKTGIQSQNITLKYTI